MKNMICFTALALMSVGTIHAQQRSGGPVTVPAPAVSWSTPLERDVVKGLPYSAEMVTEHVQTLADGNRIVRRTTGRVYRDSQGRVRREEDRPSGTPSITITDAVAGVNYTLDPARRTARETPNFGLLSGAVAKQETVRLNGVATTLAVLAGGGWVTPGSRGGGLVASNEVGGGDNRAEERLQDRVVEGVLASGVRRTTTIPAGAIGNEQPIKIVSEEWRSPELQVFVSTDRIDPQTGRTTYRLLRINRAEPDSTLFQVPSDYTIVKPLGGRGGRGAQ